MIKTPIKMVLNRSTITVYYCTMEEVRDDREEEEEESATTEGCVTWVIL